MGISGWFKVFGETASVVNDGFKDKVIGIDASYDIYRASLGMSSLYGLTDDNGTPTILLNTLLCNIVKYKKAGIGGLIYIFDNPLPNPLKKKETDKRKDKRKKALGDVLDGNDSDMVIKQTFTITDDMISDVKKLLSLIGVSWIVAPEGYEAEHLGAELSISGVIDTLITSDADSLLFGATSVSRRVVSGTNKKKKVFEEHVLSNILEKYNLTHEELIHLGVVMGCDFADKTKGIGQKTILTKGLQVELTEEQIIAKEYFQTKCEWNADMIIKHPRDKDGLIEWLVEEKKFNRIRVTQLLSQF